MRAFQRAAGFAVAASLAGLTGCGLGTEGGFIGGRDLDLCADTIPQCATTAGCRLGGTTYTETSFPGAIQFIVPAPAESTITVGLFFRDVQATGADHLIEFNEPGCFSTEVWRPRGDDLFRAAGDDRILEVSEQIFLDGEHLISIFSDMTADVLIKAEVNTPAGRQ